MQNNKVRMGKPNYIALNLSFEYRSQISQISDQLQTTIKDTVNFDFTPMDTDSVHMTICFLGDILETNRKEKTNVLNNLIEQFSVQFGSSILQFESFELFPPNKKNLVVAVFRCQDKLFNKNIIEYKKKFIKIGAKEENYFTAHITLGKIQNFNMSDTNNLSLTSNILKSFQNKPNSITVSGCHLV